MVTSCSSAWTVPANGAQLLEGLDPAGIVPDQLSVTVVGTVVGTVTLLVAGVEALETPAVVMMSAMPRATTGTVTNRVRTALGPRNAGTNPGTNPRRAMARVSPSRLPHIRVIGG